MGEVAPTSEQKPHPVLLAPVRQPLAAPGSPGGVPLAAMTAALLAHAALLFVLAGLPDDTLAGSGGRQLDAISVTLVNSAALEAREPSITQPPIPAAAIPIETEEGSAESNHAPQREKKQATEDKQTVPEPAKADAIVPLPPEKLKQERADESTPTPAGGVAVRGNEPTSVPPKVATAAASPGAVSEYARYISQALAKSRPRGTGTFGTVRVRLAISPTGGLASVEIVSSSGNRRLDEMAVAAVRHAALPAPPPGMTVSQLTYEVPYHFR
jgi:TonB family protein